MDDARGGRHRNPRILLNALALRGEGSGVQRYARELTRSLPQAWPEADFVALVAKGCAAELNDVVAVHLKRLRFDHGLTRRLAGARREPHGFDLVHGLDTDIPMRAKIPTVVTVHDLALFDTPWAFSHSARLGKRALVAAAIRRATAVISVSAFTAERVRHHFGRDSVVVHEAPGSLFRPPSAEEVDTVMERFRLPREFVLYVGNLEPRKDLATLARSCEQAAVPLIVTGGAIRSVRVPSGLRTLGYVADRDLASLYVAATVVAYVSQYEGFALPPIEAMACGATVMATKVGALPDLASDAAAFVPIADAQAQARMIHELVSDPERRAELQRAGIAAARALSWSRAARETVEVYRSLVS